MKTKLLLLLMFAASVANAQILFLDLGSAANDGTGDKLRAGGIKINTNFWWTSNLTWVASNSLRGAIVSLDGMTNSFAGIPAVAHLTNWANAVSNYVDTASSNRVRVAAGTGGITVTPSGSGGVMTFTIDDDDAGSGGSDAGGTNARQFGSLNLTNWSNIPTGAMANIPAMAWATNRINAALTNNHSAVATVSGFNVATLTNSGATLLQGTVAFSDSGFSGTDTVVKRNGNSSALTTATLSISSASNVAGIHNITVAATNFARVFEGTSTADESRIAISNAYFRGRLNANNITQTNITADRVAVYNGSKNLTNSAAVTTTELEFLDGVTSAIQTQLNSKQNGSATLTNLSGLPNFAFTNVVTKTAATVSGAGSGSTNYLFTLSTNALNDFYLGSSNVHIYTVGGSTLGSPIYWTAIVTNLSADTWGINFASGTNRWRFSGVYGTNAPSVLTNGTALMLSGRTDGTNCLIGYTYFAPGL